MKIEKTYIGHSEDGPISRTQISIFKSEPLRTLFFQRKITCGYRTRNFSEPNLAPRVIRGAHEGTQNQVRERNEGPRVPEAHPEKLREHRWSRSGDQLGDLQDPEIHVLF